MRAVQYILSIYSYTCAQVGTEVAQGIFITLNTPAGYLLFHYGKAYTGDSFKLVNDRLLLQGDQLQQRLSAVSAAEAKLRQELEVTSSEAAELRGQVAALQEQVAGLQGEINKKQAESEAFAQGTCVCAWGRPLEVAALDVMCFSPLHQSCSS